MSDRLSLELEPADTLRLANLCGQFDAHLKQIESRVGVEIFCRGNLFTIQGPERASRAARRLLINLYRLAENEVLTPDLVNLHLQESGVAELGEPGEADPRGEVAVKTRRGTIRGRGPNQKSYLRNIVSHAINFGVGPAGHVVGGQAVGVILTAIWASAASAAPTLLSTRRWRARWSTFRDGRGPRSSSGSSAR